MKWGKFSKIFACGVAAACLWIAACGGSSAGNVITVVVSPTNIALLANQVQTFTATVGGSDNLAVTWSCTFTTTTTDSKGNTTTTDPKPCTSVDGTLTNQTDTTVTYTAPSSVQNPPHAIQIVGTSKADTKKTGTGNILFIDSGIRVTITPSTATIATGEHFDFIAAVPNDTTPPQGVTWHLTKDATATSASVDCTDCGTLTTVNSTRVTYTAPAAVPTQATATLYATSVADTSRIGQATITMIAASSNAIKFNSVYPHEVYAGTVFQDIFIDATNLRTTTSVAIDGQPVDTSTGRLKIISNTTTTTSGSTTTTTTTPIAARLRLLSSDLTNFATHTITIQDGTGASIPCSGGTGACTYTVVPTNPVIASSTPNSFLQNQSGANLQVNGGFFGSSSNPLVKVDFAGNVLPVTVPGPRQLSAQSITAAALDTAGLFPVRVENVLNNITGVNSNSVNVAVQPDFVGANPPSATTSVSLSANALPSSMAIDSTHRIAIITQQSLNNVRMVDLNGSIALGNEFPVGHDPTSAAIDPNADGRLAGPTALVVNSTDKTVSVLQVNSPTSVTNIGTIHLTGLVPLGTGPSATVPPNPYAVGLDPYTHRALVAYSNANIGFILNLDPNPPSGTSCLLTGESLPYCAIASVTLNTGDSPQIAFEPGVHMAFVTPGGSGTTAIVDLSQSNQIAKIAAAPNGAIRSNNIVTIKLDQTDPNNKLLINPGIGGTVLISGIADDSFNGSFSVSQVIDEYTFTYQQTGTDATSGSDATHNGTVGFGNPIGSFSISPTTRGIAINPLNRTAMMADPNTSSSQLTFLSTLDQNVTSLALTVGSYLTTPGSAPEFGARFTAFQPFTNVGVSYNPLRHDISLIDPSRPQRLAPAIHLGADGSTGVGSYTPNGATATVQVYGAVAVDPASNRTFVASAGTNTLYWLSLGNDSQPANFQPASILEVRIPSGKGIPNELLPQATVTSASPLTGVQIFGRGFTSGAVTVRLDGQSITSSGGSVTVNSDEQLTVTIPPTPFLQTPHRYALDVLVSGVASNISDFTVVQAIAMAACSGTAAAPAGVAIDETRSLAVVTNSGCNNIAVINLNPGSGFGTVTTASVGTKPTGVAVIPRLGLGVVANNGSGTASIVNLNSATPTIISSPTVGTNPNGVAINSETGQALVVNTGSNTLSSFDLNKAIGSTTAPTVATSGTDQNPLAVAIYPDGNGGVGSAVVTALQLATISGVTQAFGTLDVFNLNSNLSASPTKNTSLSISAISATPTGIAFDPAAIAPTSGQTNFSPLFYVTSSRSNTITTFNPNTATTTSFRVGINPTSVAFNYHTGTLLTVNSSSNTISIVDAQTFKTRATLALGSVAPFAAAIHPRTNLAVIADQANNRVLLFPLP